MKKQKYLHKELREHIKNFLISKSVKYILLAGVQLFFSFITLSAQDTLLLKKYFKNLKTLDVIIGGKNYSFLFDTGGGETFISPAIAKDLSRAVYGKSSGFRMSGEMITYQKCDSINLKIGRTSIFSETVPVWDLMSILPKELPRLDGIISLKTLDRHQITLDLANNMIIIETAISFKNKIRNVTQLPVRFANGLTGNEINVFIGLKKNDRLYWFLFDSGNLDKFRFSPVTAYEWGLKKDTASIREEFQNVSIPFGKKNITVTGVSENIIYDGALNFAFIQQSVYFIDLVSRKMWMN